MERRFVSFRDVKVKDRMVKGTEAVNKKDKEEVKEDVSRAEDTVSEG